MSSEESQLTEQISSELLLENEYNTVVIVDGGGASQTYELETSLTNPFDFDLSRLAPGNQAATLERFIDLATLVIADGQQRAGIAEEDRVVLVEDYPGEQTQRFGHEVITWRIKSRKPANMSAKGTSRPQRTAAYSHQGMDPKYPNKSIVVMARPIDHLVEFSCWSKNAGKANSRALWLERLLISYSWAFTSQGVDRFFWKERGIDTYTITNGQHLYQRPLTFFVRLFEFNILAYPIVRQITYEVGQTLS
jgi:hypothetical protein